MGLTTVLNGPVGFLLGILSGVLANFVGNLFWRHYTKPKLGINSSAQANFNVSKSGEPTSRIFRLSVRNDGKKAAENCKPELTLVGVLNNKRYEIECPLYWEDEDTDSRVTINPGETARFDVFRIVAEESGNVVPTGYEFYVEFPGGPDWSDSKNIVRWHLDANGGIIDGDFPNRIKKEDYTKIGWETNSIRITSKNAEKVTGSLRLLPGNGQSGELIGLRMNVVTNQKSDKDLYP